MPCRGHRPRCVQRATVGQQRAIRFVPATVKSVYGFPTGLTAGAGTTIAIVDAFDDPTVQADLDKFSAQYALPCNGCLTKVNQTGGTTYPRTDAGWALEISLDVQWAHAIAPGAKILLVEAALGQFHRPVGGRGLRQGPRRLRLEQLGWRGVLQRILLSTVTSRQPESASSCRPATSGLPSRVSLVVAECDLGRRHLAG